MRHFFGFTIADEEEDNEEDIQTENQVPELTHVEKLQNQSHLMQTIQKTNQLNLDSKPIHRLKIQYSRELGLVGRKSAPSFFSNIGQSYLPLTCKHSINTGARFFCGKFSKDGNIFVSAAQDEVFRVFDSSKGHLEFKSEFAAKDIGWSIIDTDFSPDQRFLIYSSWSHYIHMCNLQSPETAYEALDLRPTDERFCAFSLRFSPTSDEIVAGCSDRSIYIYDLTVKKRTLKITGHQNDINTVTFADDSSSNVILSGSDDCMIKVWDRRSLKSDGKAQGCLSGHTQGVTCVRAKGDSRYFISNGKDQVLKLWDIRKMTDSVTPPSTYSNFDYRFMTHYAKPKQVNDVSLFTFSGHSIFKTLIRCEFSPQHTTGGRYVVTGSYDGFVYFYDILTGERCQSRYRHRSIVRDISWHPFHPLLVSSSWDGHLGIHGPETKLSPQQDLVNSVVTDDLPSRISTFY